MTCETCGKSDCMCALVELFIPKHDVSWMDGAACKGMDSDMFYIDVGKSAEPARSVCQGCLVRFECLDYALKTNQYHGIWGGLTERQRRDIKRRRGAA